MVNVKDTLKKYTMVIALVVVIAFFYVGTGGTILFSQNINNLLSQNAYVFVLATGMLLCILTGGNIDLSVGSVVCFTGGAKYEIYCIINDLVAAGKSVIMISSELPEVLGMSDRIYVMNEGKMVGEMAQNEASQESIMSCILKSGREK